MPLTTYTAGEVLTAASLNANFTFAAENPTGGLVRVGGGTLSGASTTFSSVFSATYAAYKVVLTNLLSSDHTYFQIGSATTAYYTSGAKVTYAGVVSANAFSNSSQFDRLGYSAGTNLFGATIEIQNPFLAAETTVQYSFINTNPSDGGGLMAGFLDNTTSYTSIKIGASSGTLTGTCNIYGYSLS